MAIFANRYIHDNHLIHSPMTLLIVAIVVTAYALIASDRFTRINKATVAIFAGTLGWVVYICFGADFVDSQHPDEYFDWLSGAVSTSDVVKQYIAENVFLPYVARAAEIAFFLLATMSIADLLITNGCLDYLRSWMRTRHSKRLLWTITAVTFLISANLDNLTTTIVMLMVMRDIVANRKQRRLYGSSIVIAANAGGAMTVIGDPTGLFLWNIGAVSASAFSLHLLVPSLIAWALPTWLMGRMLPERIDIESQLNAYRDGKTSLWVYIKQIVMLIIGIGGLWSIPTLYNITHLSPFLGALCVLSALWLTNELFNRKSLDAGNMIIPRIPKVLQYETVQTILFVTGIVLSIGVVQETGAIRWLTIILDDTFHNVWLGGLLAGVVSSVLDNFATAVSFFAFHDVADASVAADSFMANFQQNGNSWNIIAYCTAVGGNILLIGSLSGIAWMKTENVRLGWYFRNVGLKAALGWLVGFAAMYLVSVI